MIILTYIFPETDLSFVEKEMEKGRKDGILEQGDRCEIVSLK